MRDVKLTKNGRLTVASAEAIPKNFIEALILESCPDMSQEMLDEIAQET